MSLLPILLAAAQAHDLRVDVLDVGQGDSILVTVGNQEAVILIDAGDASAGVARQLLARGVNHLDLAISTHPHADHIGGMSAVLRTLHVENYLDRSVKYDSLTWSELDATLRERKAAGLQVHHTEAPLPQLRLASDTTLTLLFPLPGERFEGTRSDENANSLVFRLDHGSDCFLFMGDAGAQTERILLARGLQTCDVLKVGHHGSNDASSADFLAAVRPRAALVSVGRNNSYGHPAAGATARLAQAGAAVWRTDIFGALTVWSTGHGWLVTPTPLLPAPVVRDAPPSTGPMAASSCPYPASRNSEVFHEEGCGMAGRIYAENLQCYPSRQAALDTGRRPGACCHP